MSRLALVLSCGLLALAFGGEKNAKKDTAPYAVVAGSVFRDPGFALAGAEVVIEAVAAEAAPAFKKQKTTTNFRGEFAFRVPAEARKYNVSAAAKGLRGETKAAATQGGEERIDVTFLLSPESK